MSSVNNTGGCKPCTLDTQHQPYRWGRVVYAAACLGSVVLAIAAENVGHPTRSQRTWCYGTAAILGGLGAYMAGQDQLVERALASLASVCCKRSEDL